MSGGAPPPGYFSQYPPPAGYPPAGGAPPPAGFPPAGAPPAGFPPGGYPPAGYPQQGAGYPPQGAGYPPQGFPPQGAGYPPQGFPPQGAYPGYPPAAGFPPGPFPAPGAPAAPAITPGVTVLSQSEQGAIRFQSTGSIGDWQAIPQPPSHNHQSLVGVVHQGIVYIFAIDSEMRLMYCVFTPGTGWSAWTVQQDGRLKGNIAAASCNNALYVFGRGTEDKLHIRTLVNGQWTPWMDTFPGPSNNRLASSPAVIGSHDTMELFARAHDGHIWSAGFQRGAWSHWTEVPGQGVAKDGLAVARASDGTLHLAVVGLDDAVYVQRRNPQTLQWAPAWSSVGGITHHPISAACHGTDLHIVCTGTDNTVYHQIAGKTHWAQMPRSNNSRFGPGIFVL